MSSDNDNTQNTFVSATGAALKCDLHGIETFDLNVWNEHCSDPANGHTESGEAPCVDCGAMLSFEGIPYVPITPKGKEIKIRCDNCVNNLIQQSNVIRGVNKQ